MPFLETIINLMAPHNCLVCGREGAVICKACMTLEIPTVPSRCYRCLQATRDYATCGSCRRNTSLGHVWVRSLYENVSSRAVLAYKFERARATHIPIAAALAETIPIISKDTLIIGVPTTTARIRLRGYDHVRLLVRQFASGSRLVWAAPVVRSGQAHQWLITPSTPQTA